MRERGVDVAWISDKKLSSPQRRIRNDLISQLEAKGQNTSYNRDLVNDYIVMLKTRDKLQNDIDERGTLLEYNNGGGQKGWKKNDSIDQYNKICDRMVKHLYFLGIKPSETVTGDDDDEL